MTTTATFFISTLGSAIEMRTPYDEKLNDRIKAISGAVWSRGRHAWLFPATPAFAETIAREFFGGYNWVFDATANVRAPGAPVVWDDGFRRLLVDWMAVIDAQRWKTSVTWRNDIGTVTPPWEHQARAFAFAAHLRAVMLAMEVGTGKSLVACALCKLHGARKVLIVGPLKALPVWPMQFEWHVPDYRMNVVSLQKGTVAKRAEIAERELTLAEATGRPIALVINYESVWREPFAGLALAAGFDTVIADESQRIKDPGGKASKFMERVGGRAKWRMGLSGTPMHDKPIDIYAQYRFLDSGIFGKSYQLFKQEYTVEHPEIPNFILKYKNQDELNRKFHSIAFVADQSVLKLPPDLDIVQPCELSSKAMRVYRDIEDQFIAEIVLEALDGGETTTAFAQNAMVKLTRLQQITSGFIRDEAGRDVMLDSTKEALLHDMLVDLAETEPVVVFARFTNDLEAIHRVADRLKRGYMEVSGQVDNLLQWQQGGPPILGVQIQAGGVGVDLTRSHHAIYYSLGLSLGDYRQTRGRLVRPGQKHSVRFYHMLAAGTVDWRIYRALEAKADIVNSVMKEMKKR